MRKECLLSAILLLNGCATGYYEGYVGDGYNTTQYAPNVFSISYHGNSMTNRQQAKDFALLRSAEVALENGFGYFSIQNSESYSTNSSVILPATTNTHFNGNGTATSITYGGQAIRLSSPSTENLIVCYKKKPSNAFSYDARYLFRSLIKKYNIRQPIPVKATENPFDGLEPQGM